MTPELIAALIQAVPSLAYALVIVWIWERQTRSNREREEADRAERAEREKAQRQATIDREAKDREERAAIEARNAAERKEQAEIWQRFIGEQREFDRQHGLQLADRMESILSSHGHRLDNQEQVLARHAEVMQSLTVTLQATNATMDVLRKQYEKLLGHDG